MKSTPIVILAFGCLDAANYWVGIQAGLNLQTCNSVNWEEPSWWESGAGCGANHEFYFGSGQQFLQFGLENELLYQKVRYSSVIPAMPSGDLEFNDIIISLLVKGKKNLSNKADFKIGFGWSIIKHLNAYYGTLQLPDADFSIGQGFQSKAELNIRLNPKLCLNPSLRYQMNLNEEYPGLLINIKNARALHFNLGLAFGL